MEGDPIRSWIPMRRCHFNPLPPHGGRQKRDCGTRMVFAFQSTPSAWRETCTFLYPPPPDVISIHSLRMEGDFTLLIWNICCIISIHSLRMEGDLVKITNTNQLFIISIHSLRMEGDRFNLVFFVFFIYFNPLPPHGGRLVTTVATVISGNISIHSLRMEGDILLLYPNI